MSIKTPAPTEPVPNPLHAFASYSYALSLWWLNEDDYNNLVSCTDVDSAMAYELKKSYVLAEDSGLYTDVRMPATAGLNYHLQDLKMETSVAPSKGMGQTNSFGGSFTIIEPYGATFMNCIVNQAAVDADASGEKTSANYVAKSYLLQIDFFGYDDEGKQVPRSRTDIFRKRYPIQITVMKMELKNSGMEYQCKFIPSTHKALLPLAVKLPEAMTVTNVRTFGDLVDGLAKQYNEFMQDKVRRGLQQYADTIKFDVDPEIYVTPIVNPNTATIGQANVSDKTLDLTKSAFMYSNQADIMDILQKAFAQSKFLIDGQLGLGEFDVPEKAANNAEILTTYKVVVQSLLKGVNAQGSAFHARQANDQQRNVPAHEYTYKIHQYATSGGTHTLDKSQYADTRKIVSKMYNYTFTGQNIDVRDIKLDFQWDYYTAILAYGKNIEASSVTASSRAENNALNNNVKTSGYALTPQMLLSGGFIPQLTREQILMPTVIQTQVSNANTQAGLKGKAGAIAGQDVLKNKQLSSMLALTIEIIGDPTLLKEDDSTYTPSPTKSTNYNNWDTMSQFDFAAKYGHLRMDVFDTIIGIQVNSPIDMDTEYGNTGLAFPPMSRNGTLASYFSGQYYLYTITSTFSKGTFVQSLKMGRVPNQEIVNNSPPSNPGAPGDLQNNQREGVGSNGTFVNGGVIIVNGN